MGAAQRTVWLRRWLSRRLWLPAFLYAAMPWIYGGLGGLALVSGLFLPDPAWILPYLLLLSTAGIHAGIWVLILRRRWRYRRLLKAREPDPGAESRSVLS